ncbi:hypothetical protein TNCV_4801861 [Trichonephila clavipes]|nr:hypothetical protein TNCV_4801861 [Trichonephila clavipes]
MGFLWFRKIEYRSVEFSAKTGRSSAEHAPSHLPEKTLLTTLFQQRRKLIQHESVFFVTQRETVNCRMSEEKQDSRVQIAMLIYVQYRVFKSYTMKFGSFHAKIGEVEIGGVASYRPFGNFAKLILTVTCMVPNANDRRTSSPLPG